MTPPLFLEEFSSAPSASTGSSAPKANGAAPQQATGAPDPGHLENARLAGYEAGYRAGWDDCAQSEADDQNRIGAEFARNLQDLGFTFHEARAHVMATLEPLLTGMVEHVLPRLVSETIGDTVVEELMQLAATASDDPVEIVINPESRARIEALLGNEVVVPWAIVEEPTLAEGQVFLRSGRTERHIDFTTAIARVGAAIKGLYALNEKAFQNG